MKIALCFYGQPRWLNNPYTYDAFKKHIYSQGDVDVYTHYWWDSNIEFYKPSDFADRQFKMTALPNTPELINNMYNPSGFICEPPREFFVEDHVDEETKIKLIETGYYSETDFKAFLSHYYSSEKNLSLVINKNYDVIIYTRFDALISSMGDLSLIKEDTLYYSNMYNGGFSDIIFIFTPSVVHKIKFYSELQETYNYFFNDRSCVQEYSPGPNCYKKAHFVKNIGCSNIVPFDWFVSIIRSDVDNKGQY